MGLFKSRHARELDAIIMRIEMNMANNYKDNAQSELKELESAIDKLLGEGLLKEKDVLFYKEKLTGYKERLKGYSHKDQKPYWTK